MYFIVVWAYGMNFDLKQITLKLDCGVISDSLLMATLRENPATYKLNF